MDAHKKAMRPIWQQIQYLFWERKHVDESEELTVAKTLIDWSIESFYIKHPLVPEAKIPMYRVFEMERRKDKK